ncbi:ACP phosphodiesterase [Providencia burhodogranariea]|uniref:Acyl carrier protein phosphodiesterase n=1 Tax=Providencia burhodogranariea DSM 19968 TaxID=1141662 RepID=K8W4G6_9GAMM|nr:ACP phosphodiesterase [Providencia burhodogranariea]EKT55473.1 Acyl carrier protein phosphodiesterase [Providencia burhodogranariea DSM 19968]
MNFLAHLHLAHLADSSLLGNIMADFVRGNPSGLYAPDIVAGIFMHRAVDRATDSHPLVKEARALFRPEYRRVASITLDLVWDHFLSLHWTRIEPELSLLEFIDFARQHIEPHLCHTPEKFQELNEYLWPQRWLIRYAEKEYIGKSLNGMARRRPKLQALSGSFDDFLLQYEQLEQIFFNFYPQMVQSAKKNIFNVGSLSRHLTADITQITGN